MINVTNYIDIVFTGDVRDAYMLYKELKDNFIESEWSIKQHYNVHSLFKITSVEEAEYYDEIFVWEDDIKEFIKKNSNIEVDVIETKTVYRGE